MLVSQLGLNAPSIRAPCQALASGSQVPVCFGHLVLGNKPKEISVRAFRWNAPQLIIFGLPLTCVNPWARAILLTSRAC